ncbi:hypothetical protein CAEBREN_22670 [Caenorhabditis brenneri]|uniref:Uncharacterized protein n=1 Tax=Caenorhabditis brenneri TaxID=135651 RepID=G0NGL6_CAEBE|nr:hypothetical protein CAEBREN_22670 [Caenorhabditis brenneri]
MNRIIQSMNKTPNHYLYVTIANGIMIQIQSKRNEEYSELMNLTAKEHEPERRYTFNMEIGSLGYFPSAFFVLNDSQVVVDTYWNNIKAVRYDTNEEYSEQMNVTVKENEPVGRFSPWKRETFNMETGSLGYFPSAFCEYVDGQVVVETYWKSIKAGCIELCNELVQVFNTPVRAVTLELDKTINYLNEISWTNSTFPGLITFKPELYRSNKCAARKEQTSQKIHIHYENRLCG